MRKRDHANTNQEIEGVAMLFLDKDDSEQGKLWRSKRAFHMKQGSVFQDDLPTLDMHLPKHTPSDYRR